MAATTDTQTQTTHEDLIVKLEGQPVTRLRRIAPSGTSKLAKPELVRRIVEEREPEGRALVGMPLPEKVEPGKPAKLSNRDKQRLGDALIVAAADLVDHLDENDLTKGIDKDLAAQAVGSWFVYQPRSIVVDADGNKTRFWDERLPYDPPKSWRDR